MFQFLVVCLLVAGCRAMPSQMGVIEGPVQLKAVTIKAHNPPYVMFDENGTEYGFAIDLLNEISAKANFNVSMYYIPVRNGGNSKPGLVNKVLNEVNLKNADFGLVDVAITDERKKLVDFTESIMDNISIVGLVSRLKIWETCTIGELVKDNNLNGEATWGMIRDGDTHKIMTESTDYVAKRLTLMMNPSKDKMLFEAYRDALDMAHTYRQAIILESDYALYQAAQNCDLALLPDNRGFPKRTYGLPVSKDSPHLHKFNQAIRELKAEGTLDKLKAKYWTRNCKNKLYAC